jgi:hypothetical protein
VTAQHHHGLRLSELAGAVELRCSFSVDRVPLLTSHLGQGRLVVASTLLGLRCSQGDFVFRRDDEVRITAVRRWLGGGTLHIVSPSLRGQARVRDLAATLVELQQRDWHVDN